MTPSERQVQQVWLISIILIAFGISGLFANVLQWPRDLLILGYSVIAAVVIALYTVQTHASWRSRLGHQWRAGAAAGTAVGALLALNVAGQPDAEASQGLAMVWDLLWSGLVYGVVDGLWLNVLPVVVTLRFAQGPKWALWGLALSASLMVTAAYHLGYAEFQGPQVIQPLVGNAVITAGYLATGSPIAALLAHVIMHLAAVLHGMETTAQLPPHY